MRRRKRYQKGSLTRQFIGGRKVWYAQWRNEYGERRTRILGECSMLSESKAWLALAEVLRPINEGICKPTGAVCTFAQFVGEVYLPHARRGWKKDSTARTSEDSIDGYLVREFGSKLMHTIRREQMQDFLDRKADQYSYSVVSHLRWFLKAIFDLAKSDEVVTSNPAAELIVNKDRCKRGREVRPLREEEVVQYLNVLDIRERLIARLAIFEGMRPGEILALQWRHVSETAAEVAQRIYRGSINSPKNGKARQIALSDGTILELKAWRELALDSSPDGYIFPSEALKTPLSRDNLGRRNMKPRLEKVGLDWATFQILRSTNASLGEKAKANAEASADQRGHGIGVSLDRYTRSDIEQKREVVNSIEEMVFGKRKPTLAAA